jgi:quinol monooxygenase YgiN
MSFAVVVTFVVKPDQMATFMPLMIANARASLNDEPECVQFDVLAEPDRPDEVVLYELYKSASAFQDHLNSPHFKSFAAAVHEMIASRDIKTFTNVSQ